MSGLVDKGRAVYVDCFDLSKVFEIILHSILTKKNEDIMSGREQWGPKEPGLGDPALTRGFA